MMMMKPPTVPANHANAPSYDDLVNALEQIRHATAPTPNDGGHHEAAHDLADAVLKRIHARLEYERSMCPHQHAVDDHRLHSADDPRAAAVRESYGYVTQRGR